MGNCSSEVWLSKILNTGDNWQLYSFYNCLNSFKLIKERNYYSHAYHGLMEKLLLSCISWTHGYHGEITTLMHIMDSRFKNLNQVGAHFTHHTIQLLFEVIYKHALVSTSLSGFNPNHNDILIANLPSNQRR